jgi:GNAT superfamily N-acetyltransferase
VIKVTQHSPGGNIRPFIRAAHVVFKGDPAWVPPLNLELKDRLSPKRNPFFKRAEVVLFTATKNGKIVGRCSAQIDHEHLRVWKDDTGFFGFFDTIDDEEVGKALISAAETWLRDRGMKRMRGPLSLYVNEEIGILVDGFDTPPSLMMGHSRPYQGRICEAAGLTKEKDLFCWKYGAEMEFPPRILKAWEGIKALPEVRLRSVNVKSMQSETEAIMDIYNDAWTGKWGYVPALPDEVAKVAQDLKLIIDEDLAFMAEIDGKIAGMCIMLPNINEAIRDLNGKLFPTGLFKLLYRLKVKHPKSTRLMMLGIKSQYRGVKKYGGLSAAMYVEVAKRGRAKGYEWGELSWTREDDGPINVGIKAMGAKVYKTYRVYEKPIAT